MQQVELELREDFEFYCPVTGQQVLSDDSFDASPAMTFCYIEDVGAFEFANDWTQKEFGLKSADPDDYYLDFNKFHHMLSDLIDKKDYPNLVCFSITTEGMACGPISSTVHFCIDMDYTPETIG